MLKNVYVPWRLSKFGIGENHRAYPQDSSLHIFGADTETVDGVPYTIQISGPPKYGKPQEIIERVTPRTIFPVFIDWIKNQVGNSNRVNICWFHNLRFDQTALFFENIQTIYDQYNDISFERDGYLIQMLYGRVNKAQIWEDLGGYICGPCFENTGKSVPAEATEMVKTEKGRKRICTRHRTSEPTVKRNTGFKVTLLDSAAFCPPGGKSLAAALKIYGVNEVKMKKPEGLGVVKLWDDYFKEYAMNDARVERELALKILELHKSYNVTVCVSLPQLASRILRHHFFKAGERLEFPPDQCRLASEHSYHAGKNGFYVTRGVYENVREYDINSAFPKAMRDLPQMVKGRYVKTAVYQEDLVGIYRVQGRATKVKYPAIFESNFSAIKEGEFRDVWVTGFEVDCMLRDPGYDFLIDKGYVWKPDPRHTHSPLAEFVEEFWRLKNTTPKGPKRDTYKNILNSLYGKFAACVEKRQIIDSAFGLTVVNDPTIPSKYFVAGALYHPFIASQITGSVRRDLYNLEHRGKSLHSATDSIKSLLKLETSDELGGTKEECHGRCFLFRTKLYLHFSKDTSLCGHDVDRPWIRDRGESHSIFDQDQHLCKFALHGFKGSVRELYERRFELLEAGALEYDYQHMVSLREGMIRGEKISTMVKRREKLLLPLN